MRMILVAILMLLIHINAGSCFGLSFNPSVNCNHDSDCPQGYHCANDRLCREIQTFDLAVEKLEIPEVLEWADDFYITFQARNNGNTKVSNDFKVEFYLSKDRVLNVNVNNSDILIGTYEHRGVVASRSTGSSQNILTELPQEKPDGFSEPGPFYVIAKTDSNNQIDENSEDNNLRNVQFMTPTVRLSIDKSQTRESPFPQRLISFNNYAVVSVILTKSRRNPVTVAYKTIEHGGSPGFPVYAASRGSDYEHKEGKVQFRYDAAHRDGELKKEIRIPIKYDAFPEPDEVFKVMIHDTVNASAIGVGEVGITIKDNLRSNIGQIPTLHSIDATVYEGNIGVIPLHVFPLGSQDIEVTYMTSRVDEGTAEEGQDYERTSDTITIPRGTQSGEIVVPIIDDDLSENSEFFYIRITKIKNAILDGSPRFRIEIRDDDSGD